MDKRSMPIFVTLLLIVGIITSGCTETISTAGLPDEPAGQKIDYDGMPYISKADIGTITDMGQNHYNIVVICKEQKIDCGNDNALQISFDDSDRRKILVTVEKGNIRPMGLNAFDAEGKYIESKFYASYTEVETKDQVWYASTKEKVSYIQILWGVEKQQEGS